MEDDCFMFVHGSNGKMIFLKNELKEAVKNVTDKSHIIPPK